MMHNGEAIHAFLCKICIVTGDIGGQKKAIKGAKIRHNLFFYKNLTQNIELLLHRGNFYGIYVMSHAIK